MRASGRLGRGSVWKRRGASGPLPEAPEKPSRAAGYIFRFASHCIITISPWGGIVSYISKL